MHAEVTRLDALGSTIYSTVISRELRRNLEIGSWSGEGSTRCFVEAMKQLGGDLHIDCVEIVPDKFLHMKNLYSSLNFVHCHNKSSISYDELVYKDFEDIWNSPYNRIPKHIHSKETVKSWFDRDVVSIQESDNMKLSTLPAYDGVFIDGSEFTGFSEYLLIKDKARVIFLDDVHNAFKCFEVHEALMRDPEWDCIVDAPNVRNGFSVFGRK